MDITDIIGAMKSWQYHTDFVLKTLSTMLLNRDLLKIEIQHKEIPATKISDKIQLVMQQFNLSEDQASYFVFSDSISNQAYRMDKDTINLVTKKGIYDSYLLVKKALLFMEKQIYPMPTTVCEPKLDKHRLMKTFSTVGNRNIYLDFLRYADGKNSLNIISKKTKFQLLINSYLLYFKKKKNSLLKE